MLVSSPFSPHPLPQTHSPLTDCTREPVNQVKCVPLREPHGSLGKKKKKGFDVFLLYFKTRDSPRRGRNHCGEPFPVLLLQAAASFSGSSPTMLSAAASFEALQCKGPASTQDSMCHPEDDLTDPREVSFQVKGYTFSEPVHLTVSYGEVLERTDQCRQLFLPFPKALLSAPQPTQEGTPRKLAMGRDTICSIFSPRSQGTLCARP